MADWHDMVGIGKSVEGNFLADWNDMAGIGKGVGPTILRLKMWLGLGLMGITVLALTWQTTIVYTEWGITWLLGIPEWTEEKFSHFVNHVAQPVMTWLVGIQG